MNNYELTPQGLKTSDPVIAAMFLGAHGVYIGKEECTLESIDDYGWLRGFYNDQANTIKVSAQEIIIPKPLVREAIKPVVGEDIIWAPMAVGDGDPLRVLTEEYNEEQYSIVVQEPEVPCAHHRAFAIVQRCGQLRELIQWVEEE